MYKKRLTVGVNRTLYNATYDTSFSLLISCQVSVFNAFYLICAILGKTRCNDVCITQTTAHVKVSSQFWHMYMYQHCFTFMYVHNYSIQGICKGSEKVWTTCYKVQECDVYCVVTCLLLCHCAWLFLRERYCLADR